MIGFGIKLEKFKSMFFDPVMRRMEDVAGRNLSKFGAFVRRRAQTSMPKRKKASEPGNPPSSHTGVLRRLIYFGYDPGRGSVIIGPIPTNQVFFDRNRKPVRGTVPSVLEYGGDITVLERLQGSEWVRADLRSQRRWAGAHTRYRDITIKARPYMQPAFDEEIKQLPALWRNAVA
jgi:hypothetical protein